MQQPAKKMPWALDRLTARGLLRQVTDLRDGSTERSNGATLTYDFLGRLTGFDSPYNALDATYTYDALGNLTQKGTRPFEYTDPQKPHQVTGVRLGSGSALPVAHDPNGNRTSETFWQKLGDYLDDWTAQKNVVQPGTQEAEILSQSIKEIPYTPTGEGLQGTLNSGNVYTYEQRFGGAELYSRQGKIFVPTRSLGLPSNYLGSQLAHEYFHVLSYRFTGLSGSEVFANRFGDTSSYIGPSRARILATYPTAEDLYRGVIRGPLTY